MRGCEDVGIEDARIEDAGRGLVLLGLRVRAFAFASAVVMQDT